MRLAVTLRYCAGGQVLDLALIYHISKKEVYKSLWRTIDAINACPELAIQFPIDDVGQTKSSLTSYLFIHLVFSHP